MPEASLPPHDAEAEMRDAGAKWLEVALALGYSSEYHANSAVRRYRARVGVAS